MYDTSKRATQLGRSVQVEYRNSNGLFDLHILANKKKIQRRSEYQTSIEDIRQKMVDIFVRFRYPRSHINANFQHTLTEAFEGRPVDSLQLSLIKHIIHINKDKCDFCQEPIKFNDLVAVTMSHDLNRKVMDGTSQKRMFSHIMHSQCSEKQAKKPVNKSENLSQQSIRMPDCDGKCYCKATFKLKTETDLQTLMLNIVD